MTASEDEKNKQTASAPAATSATPKKKPPLQHLIAGGCAGLVESSVCHPLDTIKTRMQLRRQAVDTTQVVRHSLVEPAMRLKHSLQEPALRLKHSLQEPFARGGTPAATLNAASATLHEPGALLRPASSSAAPSATITVQPTATHKAVTASLGPFGTAKRIVQREGFLALYKGLTAVYTGIIPKMAIRFVSFEWYRDMLQSQFGVSSSVTFTAGLASGLTEAILVVTPAEVCKIRMQSQYHSMMDPAQKQHRKYTNVVQTAFTIVKEEVRMKNEGGMPCSTEWNSVCTVSKLLSIRLYSTYISIYTELTKYLCLLDILKTGNWCIVQRYCAHHVATRLQSSRQLYRLQCH